MRSRNIFTALVFCFWLIPFLSTHTIAGGFKISVKKASAEYSNAYLVVIPHGCHNPSDAEITGTAEGIVNGERKSVKLKFKKSEQGVFSLDKQWPDEGNWVIVINGSYRHLVSNAIVTAEESVRTDKVKLFYNDISSKDIEDALKRSKS